MTIEFNFKYVQENPQPISYCHFMLRIMTDDFINLFIYLNPIKAADEKLFLRTGATYHQTKTKASSKEPWKEFISLSILK